MNLDTTTTTTETTTKPSAGPGSGGKKKPAKKTKKPAAKKKPVAAKKKSAKKSAAPQSLYATPAEVSKFVAGYAKQHDVTAKEATHRLLSVARSRMMAVAKYGNGPAKKSAKRGGKKGKK